MCKVMEELNKLAIKEEKRLDVQNMLKIGHDKAAFIMKKPCASVKKNMKNSLRRSQANAIKTSIRKHKGETCHQ